MFEGANYGGQIVFSPNVENYPGIASISGAQYSMNLVEQVTNLGAETKREQVKEVKKVEDGYSVVTEEGEYLCQALVLATGVTHRHLGLENEEKLTGAGVSYCATCDGMFFRGKNVAVIGGGNTALQDAEHRHLGLENEEKLTGAGVSYCATCDGMFFRGKNVAVIGGGNTALQDAEFLSNYCSKVYLVHRREEFRGDAKNVSSLREKENVEFVLNALPEEILGEQMVQGLVVTDKISGAKKTLDVDGIFVAIGHLPKNEIFAELVDLDAGGFIKAGENCETSRDGIFAAGDCDGIFVAIGHLPKNEIFAELVDLDAGGFIKAGENCETSRDGIFAAGDCRTKEVRQLTTAAADGAVAALAAVKYIK